MTGINDGWPVNSGAATFAEMRQSLQSLILTPGITYPPQASTPILSAATATMNLAIAPFAAAFMRDLPVNLATIASWGGALSSNGSSTTLTLPTAPTSNAILHTIYAKQNDSVLGENATCEVLYVSSNVAASPIYQPPTVAGAVELGTVYVPAGATTLQSSGVVITNRPRRAIMAGTPLIVQDATQRDMIVTKNTAITQMQYSGPFDLTTTAGQRALQDSGIRVFRLDTGIMEHYKSLYNATSNPGGARGGGNDWYPVEPMKLRGRATRASTASIPDSTARTAVTLTDVDTAFTRGLGWTITSGGLVVPVSGEYQVRIRLAWPSSNAGVRLVSLYVNGSEASQGIIDSRAGLGTTSTYVTVYESLVLSAGDRVQIGVAQSSGAALTLPNPAVDLTLWFLNYS